jgi:hypothetical protein
MNLIYNYTSLNSYLSNIIYKYTLWKEKPFIKELKNVTSLIFNTLNMIDINYKNYKINKLGKNWNISYDYDKSYEFNTN